MWSTGKFSRLLVGPDGSETSLHALKESFKISKNWVTVVTVALSYAGDLRIMGSAGIREKLREPRDTGLALVQEMAEAAGALIRPLCAVGEPYECLVAEAESQRRAEALNLNVHAVPPGAALPGHHQTVPARKKNLIVMGSHGHTGLTRLLMGGDTERVIDHGTCPVLVVKSKE